MSLIKPILLVDKEEDCSFMLSTLLGMSGHTVMPVGTMAEGLRLAQTKGFSLYLLSDWLQDGTGLELCTMIRQIDPDTPILFYSAQGFEADRVKALAAGAQAYLVKPDGLYDLEKTVAELLRGTGQP